MKYPSKNASPSQARVRELRKELARKIAFFVGSRETDNRRSRLAAKPTDRADGTGVRNV